MCRFAAALLLCLSLACLAGPEPVRASLHARTAGCPQPRSGEAADIIKAVEASSGTPASPVPVTGLVIPPEPEFLPQAAQAFALTRGHAYTRVILLAGTPEGEGQPVVLPDKALEHSLGAAALDERAAAALRKALCAPPAAGKGKAGAKTGDAARDAEQAEAARRFAASREVRGALPLAGLHAPGVPVLPVGVPFSSGPKQWRALFKALRPLTGKGVLVVYVARPSRELEAESALRRDQAFMRALSSHNPDLALSPASPLVAASGGALYLMTALQKASCQSRFTVLGHHAAGLPLKGGAVTGVFAQADLPVFDPAARFFAAGDFFTGRGVGMLLSNPKRKALVVERILERTQGNPLLVNFEGVLMDPASGDPRSREGRAPLPVEGMRLWMPREPTLELLKNLNVVAVSLANNHTHDFGKQAYAATQTALEQAGIAAPGQGELRELDYFTLGAATDLDNNRVPYAPLLRQEDLAAFSGRNPAKPFFVNAHLGNEYIARPNTHARGVGAMLRRAGAELIIGHHPHVPGPFEADEGGCVAWSLGNFLFDQAGAERSGALLEIVFFKTGAYWVRQLPPENMYRNFYKR